MFIYRKKNALSPELCQAFIETFEASDEKKPGHIHKKEQDIVDDSKKSTDLTISPDFLNKEEWKPLLDEFIPILEKHKHLYQQRFSKAFGTLDPIEIFPLFNIQRYLPNEGFFSFHCERATLQHSNRVLVWMVYLNTLTDQGETEFYYQHHFEEPKQGKLVIWPSDWMYLHRGIPSFTQTKYILTGWFTHLSN